MTWQMVEMYGAADGDTPDADTPHGNGHPRGLARPAPAVVWNHSLQSLLRGISCVAGEPGFSTEARRRELETLVTGLDLLLWLARPVLSGHGERCRVHVRRLRRAMLQADADRILWQKWRLSTRAGRDPTAVFREMGRGMEVLSTAGTSTDTGSLIPVSDAPALDACLRRRVKKVLEQCSTAIQADAATLNDRPLKQRRLRVLAAAFRHLEMLGGMQAHDLSVEVGGSAPAVADCLDQLLRMRLIALSMHKVEAPRRLRRQASKWLAHEALRIQQAMQSTGGKSGGSSDPDVVSVREGQIG